ncbi:MAG: hypothetical protein WCO60_17885 [Verrucomicrobiota bacterium]
MNLVENFSLPWELGYGFENFVRVHSILKDGVKQRFLQGKDGLSATSIQGLLKSLDKIHIKRPSAEKKIESNPIARALRYTESLKLLTQKYSELLSMNLRQVPAFDQNLQLFLSHLDRLLRLQRKPDAGHVVEINRFIDKGKSLRLNESYIYLNDMAKALLNRFLKLFIRVLLCSDLTGRSFFFRELFFSVTGNRMVEDRFGNTIVCDKGGCLAYPSPDYFIDKRMKVFTPRLLNGMKPAALNRIARFMADSSASAPREVFSLLRANMKKIGWHLISNARYFCLTLVEVLLHGRCEQWLVLSSNSDAPKPIFDRGLVRECAEGIAYKYVAELNGKGMDARIISQALYRHFEAGEYPKPERFLPCDDCRKKGFYEAVTSNPGISFTVFGRYDHLRTIFGRRSNPGLREVNERHGIKDVPAMVLLSKFKVDAWPIAMVRYTNDQLVVRDSIRTKRLAKRQAVDLKPRLRLSLRTDGTGQAVKSGKAH